MLRLTASTLLLVAGLAWCLPRAAERPFSAVKAAYQPSDLWLLDRHGALLDSVRVGLDARRLAWTPLAAVSPTLAQAVVAVEDRRFADHRGIDLLAGVGAVVHAAAGAKLRGASTLTMQLAALLDPSLRHGGARSPRQKLRQARAALALETSWSKPEILEAYLNLVTFRGELVGIAAAAHGLFGKEPHGLGADESLLLATLIAAPNATPAEAVRRGCRVATATGLGSCTRLTSLIETTLRRSPRGQALASLAPHAARRLIGDRSVKKGGTLTSTLDAVLQRLAVDEVRAQLADLAGRNVHDAAVLAVDNATGDVLAYVGSAPATSLAPEVDGVRAKRQAGSTLKPFLYSLAFESRYITTATLLDDSPVEIPVSGGLYRPRNYDERFHGPVSARTALASSLNVPAVQVLQLVGTDAFLARLKDLGFRIPQGGDFFGPSLALGAVDVSLWELVGAFRALALGGRTGELRLSHATAEAGLAGVIDPAAAYLVSDILSDRSARALTFGLENSLATPFYTAVKTGTSKDMRDNWCVGYSEAYTVGVWVGNFDGQPMWNVSGISGAAPVWLKMMRQLHDHRPSTKPAPPAGVVAAGYADADGRHVTDVFLEGTAPTSVRLAAATPAGARLTYPINGMILAADPDIPPAQQLLYPEVAPAAAAGELRLDGRKLARDTPLSVAKLALGSHDLALVGPTGRTLDQVRFYVGGRGADLAPTVSVAP